MFVCADEFPLLRDDEHAISPKQMRVKKRERDRKREEI
jgi:hypothetical protein